MREVKARHKWDKKNECVTCGCTRLSLKNDTNPYWTKYEYVHKDTGEIVSKCYSNQLKLNI